MMAYYIIVDKNNVVETYGMCENFSEFNAETQETSKIFEISKTEYDELLDVLGKNRYAFKTELGFSPVNSIFKSWYYIKFIDCEYDNIKIETDDELITLLYENDLIWMSTSHSVILELYSQYLDAYGKVLVGGLGLGIVALLAASKENVSEVIVVEKDINVINAFNHQLFDKDKITILHEDLYKHEGTYDVALLDHYNMTNELESFIYSEYKKISDKIKAKYYNFYLWEYVESTSYDKYIEFANKINSKVYTKKQWEYYVSLSKKYNPPPDNLLNAIKKINNNRTPLYNLSKSDLQVLFESAENEIKTNCPLYNNTSHSMKYDYGMYRIGDSEYLAAGITWKNDNRMFSAKYQEGKITDVYEIYEDSEYFSAEINPDTLEIIALYSKTGNDKINPETNEIIQKNIPVKTVYDIPDVECRYLLHVGFPFIDNIFYYAEKPYGKTVEFSVEGLFD